jgi:hypothetical protein
MSATSKNGVCATHLAVEVLTDLANGVPHVAVGWIRIVGRMCTFIYIEDCCLEMPEPNCCAHLAMRCEDGALGLWPGTFEL